MNNKGEILLARMMSLYGLKEVDGNESNKELLAMINSIVPWVEDDSKFSWCATIIVWLFMDLGWAHLIPENPLAARSWTKLQGTTIWEDGMDVKLITKLARPGDVIVFWRTNKKTSWHGHISLFINEYHYDRTKIRVIGGNQSNGILSRAYSKNRVLKVIRL